MLSYALSWNFHYLNVHLLKQAEEAKLAAEKAFEDCSDVARQEVSN